MKINIKNELERLDLEAHVDHYLHRPINVLNHTTTVRQAIQEVRDGMTDPHLSYFYVLGNNGTLSGVVSAHLLLKSDPNQVIGDIMDDHVITVQKEAPLRSALRIISENHFASVPVIDSKGRLQGVIEIDAQKNLNEEERKLTAILRKQNKRDIFQIIGLSLEQTSEGSFIADYALRMPWLFGNLFAGIVCAVIASHFSLVLDEIVALAMFIPLVLTLSESIAMQSLTLNLVFLHHERIPWKLFMSRLFHEWKTTFFLGATSCATVAAVYLFIQGGFMTMLSISVSIFVSMFVSATIGIVFPLVLHKLKLDPKVAAGPVVLMGADIVATAIYLGLATYLLT